MDNLHVIWKDPTLFLKSPFFLKYHSCSLFCKFSYFSSSPSFFFFPWPFIRQLPSAVSFYAFCPCAYVLLLWIFFPFLINFFNISFILFAGMVYQMTAVKCLLQRCCQMMYKYLGRKEHLDFGFTVLELQHMLIICLRMLGMGKLRKYHKLAIWSFCWFCFEALPDAQLKEWHLLFL